MFLKLMYITNNPRVALIAEKYGVDRIMIDLETLGKDERQKGMNTVKSNHTIEDIQLISKLLTKSEMLVRINPWNENSLTEIEKVISSGAKRIMLPMWRTADEVTCFLEAVGGRVNTMLLLETKEAVENIDEVLKNPLIDEIHIGLNDLHLSYGLSFMFELLSNGIVEMLCKKFREKKISYGFGGIARIGEGMLPAENIIMEHYRLGSSRVILSRSFCNAEELVDIDLIESVFSKNMALLIDYENKLEKCSSLNYDENVKFIKNNVNVIVNKIKEKRVDE